MNEQGVKTESPAAHSSQSSLPEPHFDDIAIAIARPVEPLSEKRSARWPALGMLRKHVSTTALLVILAGAIGFASVTFGLTAVHQQLSPDEQTAIAPPEQSAPVKIVEISKSKDSSARPAVGIPRPRTIGSQSKSEARLVGVIR
jgi:hypothetical protein